MKIKVGSRDSLLAIAQTNIIIKQLKKIHRNIEFELIPIKTKGDKILNISLDKIGGKGLFINELEKALIIGAIDMAVHSMKDIPVNIAEGLTIAAYSEREDARDVLLSNKYKNLREMPAGSILGTSSLRRKIQALNINPNLNIKLLRGNIITRINKLELEEYDGIILAMAGLKRLDLQNKASYIFSTEEFIPAVCQGIIGIEIRQSDELINILSRIDNKISRQCAIAERAFMKTINGGCSIPMGAYAEVTNNSINIKAFYCTEATNTIVKHTTSGVIQDAEMLGTELGMRYLC